MWVIGSSSYAHTIGGSVPVDDLNSEREYKPIRAYGRTKLENILFTRELQRRAGDRLLATTCHPGASHTNLAVNTTFGMKLATWLLTPIMQSAAQGAEPILMAATSPEAKPGGYYGPGGLWGLRGHPVETPTAPFAHDHRAGHSLFCELERLAGISYGL